MRPRTRTHIHTVNVALYPKKHNHWRGKYQSKKIEWEWRRSNPQSLSHFKPLYRQNTHIRIHICKTVFIRSALYSLLLFSGCCGKVCATRRTVYKRRPLHVVHPCDSCIYCMRSPPSSVCCFWKRNLVNSVRYSSCGKTTPLKHPSPKPKSISTFNLWTIDAMRGSKPLAMPIYTSRVIYIYVHRFDLGNIIFTVCTCRGRRGWSARIGYSVLIKPAKAE